ncbi:MAG TPA: efflux RND transporter periplasmic adaptor subunit [Vicinamibacterales bacterium]|jgi:membrane fusion protein, multidrug efflux system|nr:efflux RND transporter periplasmic adaptor subunit [Vicinamibacterales bacterium]
MKKIVIIAVLVAAALAGVAFYSGVFSRGNAAQAAGQEQAAQGAPAAGAQGAGRRGAGPAGGNAGARGGGRGQLTVELASVVHADVNRELAVVGNLIGDQTVSVVPKTAGRLQEITVKLGDRVSRAQRIARIEDQEILEQVKQAEAALEVGKATIRQREADLELAKTNVERSRNLFQRQLLPQQTLDDAEAKYQSAQAALDLARAQNTQSQARLDELRFTLANTIITSPVNGFVSRRAVDPGAYVSANAPVVEVVDIQRVRLVANIIEKDLKQIGVGDMARVEVDAFPGESFMGRIARVSPVLDPATRTAPIEVEIANDQYRLKPGMYARVGIVTESHRNALVVPTNALVDANGARGVYLAVNQIAQFRPVKIGIEGNERTEVLDGLAEGDRVVTTGAAGLRNGDPIILAGGGEGRGRGNRGSRGSEGARGSLGSGSESARGAPGAAFGSRGTGFRGRNGNAGATDPGSRIPDPGEQGTGTEGRRGGFRGRRGGQQ